MLRQKNSLWNKDWHILKVITVRLENRDEKEMLKLVGKGESLCGYSEIFSFFLLRKCVHYNYLNVELRQINFGKIFFKSFEMK